MSLEKLEAEAPDADAALLLRRISIVDGVIDGPTGFARAFAYGQALGANIVKGRRACRICGCWELEACSGGCFWVAQDLCSQCSPAHARRFG